MQAAELAAQLKEAQQEHTHAAQAHATAVIQAAATQEMLEQCAQQASHGRGSSAATGLDGRQSRCLGCRVLLWLCEVAFCP